MCLSRDDILAGRVEAVAREAERLGLFRRLRPEERAASIRQTLEAFPAGAEVWVFGYGSLMWNPAFHHAERRPARVHGLHRRFCLWSAIGRGTPERPGLMLGLEPGGSCLGVAFRIASERVESELAVVWGREMIGDAYVPRVVRARTPKGPVAAIAFAINPRHERYAGRLPVETMTRVIASASGGLGSCRDYLFATVAALETLGRDHGPMHALAARVRRHMDGAG